MAKQVIQARRHNLFMCMPISFDELVGIHRSSSSHTVFVDAGWRWGGELGLVLIFRAWLAAALCGKLGLVLEICASQTDRSALQIFSCKFSEVFTHSFVTASTVGAIASLPPD